MGLKDRFANWGRLQTILSVLARHGFSGILSDVGWLKGRSIPQRLRLAFEELGPTFIKLGQVLSSRADLLPDEYIQEFEKLTDQISPFAFETVIEILRSQFDRDPYEIYSEIEKVPLAAASMAQVHRARLKDSDARVVIKVQRPGITKIVQADIHVLYFMARALEKIREEFKLANITAIVKEFQRTINEELDFSLEATRLDKFHEFFPNLEGIKIPKVYWDFTTKKVLTMTELEGTTLSQIGEIAPHVDRKYLAEQLATFFFESIFFHGLFHADAHPGNVLLNEEGKGSLGLLDFGMVGTLSADLKNQLSKLFLAVVSKDFESLAIVYAQIGEFGKKFSMKDFQTDITTFLNPHLGKPLREVHIGQLLLESTHMARKYHVRLPRDLILFYRSLMTLEHIGRKLDPEFEFLTYGQKFAGAMIRRRFSGEELMRDLMKAFEGFRLLSTELPMQVRTIVKKMDDENFPFGGSTMDRTLENFRQMARQSNLSFLTGAFLFSSTLVTALQPGSKLILPLWIASATLSAYLLLNIFRSNHRR